MERKPKLKPLRVLSPIHRSYRQLCIYFEEQSHQFGFDASTAHILTYLTSYAPCTVGEVQRVMGHKPSTMTSMLDRLQEDGLIRRVPNPCDRRSFLLECTEEGEAVGKKIRAMSDDIERKVTRRLGKADVDAYNRVLEGLANIIGASDLRDTCEPTTKKKTKSK